MGPSETATDDQTRFGTWRKLWLNLAIAEKVCTAHTACKYAADNVQELGLPISDKAIEQMKANLELDEAQMKVAAEEERKRRREFKFPTSSAFCLRAIQCGAVVPVCPACLG